VEKKEARSFDVQKLPSKTTKSYRLVIIYVGARLTQMFVLILAVLSLSKSDQLSGIEIDDGLSHERKKSRASPERQTRFRAERPSAFSKTRKVSSKNQIADLINSVSEKDAEAKSDEIQRQKKKRPAAFQTVGSSHEGNEVGPTEERNDSQKKKRTNANTPTEENDGEQPNVADSEVPRKRKRENANTPTEENDGEQPNPIDSEVPRKKKRTKANTPTEENDGEQLNECG
jgi:hypothetical protein